MDSLSRCPTKQRCINEVFIQITSLFDHHFEGVLGSLLRPEPYHAAPFNHDAGDGGPNHHTDGDDDKRDDVDPFIRCGHQATLAASSSGRPAAV